jgi:hypothetical protein
VLQLTRPWLWDRLDDGVRERIVGWLGTAVNQPYPPINWVWFRIVVESFLREVGGPWSADDIEEDLAVHASLRRPGGWLSDGQERAYDHYAGWALHLYPLLWTHLFDVTGTLCPPSLRQTWADDLARYLDDAVRLVGTDGSPLLQGRSLIYRFAAAAPFWVGAVTGTGGQPPGLVRRVTSGMVRHFTDHGAPDRDGLVTSVCGDSRLAGTYLSLHLYAFQFSARSYADWVSLFNSRIGTCGARTVLGEFGAPLDDGRNYNDAGSTDNYVRYMRAATDTVRAKGMGAIYWPAPGGKRTVRPDYDWYSLYALQGTGTNLSLSVRNTTMVDRLEYAWNTGDGSPTTTLRNAGVPGCLDVPGVSQLNGTQTMVYTCNGGANQKWTRTAGGQITVYGGTKCLEATAAGTANGTAVGINNCNGAANQKWTFYSDGTIHGAQSGRCLDVKQTMSRTQLWDCWGGTNQKWQIV